MSLINEYRATEEAIKELQARLANLSNDDKLKKERRALTVDEVNAIFEHSPEYLKPVLRMFLTTGIRRDELVNIRFEDIDPDARTVTIRAETFVYR